VIVPLLNSFHCTLSPHLPIAVTTRGVSGSSLTSSEMASLWLFSSLAFADSSMDGVSDSSVELFSDVFAD
jgi:hypothetical protein